jgi:hypothetical protein
VRPPLALAGPAGHFSACLRAHDFSATAGAVA